MNRDALFREIFDPSRPPRASRLANLSDLAPDDRAEFGRLLAAAPVDRRLRIAEDLVDLAEDNPTLSFDAIFRLMLHDADGRIRRLAIEGLWEDESRDLIEPLVRLMQSDPEISVRETAALSLGRFVVLNEFNAVRPRDAERVLAALRETIEDATQPPAVRGRAVEAIGASSADWVTEIIRRAYATNERRLQIGALNAMGRNSDARWLPILYEAMLSDDPEWRYEAAIAAGEIGDEVAVPALNDLIDDEDSEVQQAAITAIGRIGGETAIAALEERLRDAGDESPLRRALRSALSEARGASSFLPLDDDDENDDIDEAIAARLLAEDGLDDGDEDETR
jgi:HEAT repeat protein